MIDKRTESRGKAAAEWLQEDLDGGETSRVLVDASALERLLRYVKALETPPEKKVYDVYLRGEWWNTILKMDLTDDQLALLNELGERSAGTEATLVVEPHDPTAPLANWKGYTRK